MRQGLTEIVVVIDKSGSMHSVSNDVIGGFNKFLAEQKALPGEAILTMTMFDTTYNIIHNGKKIADVPELTDKTYMPGGWTALLDALGRTIDEVGKRLHETPDDARPEKVIVVVMTDGQENSSKEYRHQQIADKVKQQREIYKWEFVFLGANIDSFAIAGNLGFSKDTTVNYKPTPQGTRDAYLSASCCVKSYRSTGTTGNDWKTKI